MNERICKIESQAWEQVNRTNGLVRTEDFNQKFAELIIKECMEVVDSTPLGYGDYRDQIEKGMRDASVDRLKQHFDLAVV